MVQGVLTAVAAGQGGDPARLTVTHPTPWSDDQVAALADAVRPVVPGGVLQLIPSAVAVAVDYTVDHPLADGAAVGVVDVGATGFEAAVVGRRGTELVLLSPQVDTRPYRRRPVRRRRAAARRPRRGRRGHRAERGDDPAGPDRPGSAAPRLPPRQGGPVHRQGRHHHRLPAHRHGHGPSHPRARSTTPSAPGPRPWSRRSAAPWAASRPPRGCRPSCSPAAAPRSRCCSDCSAAPRAVRSRSPASPQRAAQRSWPHRLSRTPQPERRDELDRGAGARGRSLDEGNCRTSSPRGARQPVTVIRTASNAGTWSGQASIGMR